MSEWITDRAPTLEDGFLVYRADGTLVHFLMVPNGEPWKPVARIEPYVKPKRYEVYQSAAEHFCVGEASQRAYKAYARWYLAGYIPTREAAERIAAIYEEVMP